MSVKNLFCLPAVFAALLLSGCVNTGTGDGGTGDAGGSIINNDYIIENEPLADLPVYPTDEIHLYRTEDIAAARFTINEVEEPDSTGYQIYKIARGHYDKKEFLAAMDYFSASMKAGYDEETNSEMIENCIKAMAYGYYTKEDYRNSIAWYKRLLENGPNDRAEDNLIKSYIELGKQEGGGDGLDRMFYAYDFMKKYTKEKKYIESVSYAIGHTLNRKFRKEYLPHSLEIIKRRLELAPDPWYFSFAGRILENLNRPQEALEMYEKVMKTYPDYEHMDSVRRYYDKLSDKHYRIKIFHTFNVDTAGLEDLNCSSDYAKFDFTFPQEHAAQQVIELKVFFNGEEIEFQISEDTKGNRFGTVQLGYESLEENNTLLISVETLNKAMRTDPDNLINIPVWAYDEKDRFYIEHTKATGLYDYKDIWVQEKIHEIIGSLERKSLLDVANAVYSYVIDHMDYINDNSNTTASLGRLKALYPTGVCRDYALLTVMLLRGMGIPAEVVSGRTIPIKEDGSHHAWIVFYTPDGESVFMDTTWGDDKNDDLSLLRLESTKIATRTGLDYYKGMGRSAKKWSSCITFQDEAEEWEVEIVP